MDKSMEEHEIMKKNKKPMIIIGIVLVLCLIAAGIFALTANSAERRLANQLELGRKYLEEMDYEQAIVAFEAAIAIDPKCEEAYLALAETYVAQGTGDSGVYLPRADIYVAQDNIEKAISVLEEGYSQTGSETILTRLEELRDDYQAGRENGASTAENAQGTGGQTSGNSSSSESGQASGSSGAGSQRQPFVDPKDPFVQFVNAPFTDKNGFGDVTSLDAAVAYAESNGFVVGNFEFMPVGDLYIYYEDAEYFDPDTEELVMEPFLRVDTTDDFFDNGGCHTIYSYGGNEENPTYSIETTLGNSLGLLKTGEIPPVGGFAGFLEEHYCLTVEDILETIGLDDEELMTYVRMDNSSGEFQVETPYGPADVYLFNYSAFDIDAVNRSLTISFPENSGAPVGRIYLAEGVVRSAVYDTVTHYLVVGEGSESAESEME